MARWTSPSIYNHRTPASTARARSAHRTRQARSTLVALLALTLCLSLGWWLFGSGVWQIREIRLVGADDPTVRAAVNALPLRGQNLLRYDPSDDERRIGALPLVASVAAYKMYPSAVLFKVTLRQPTLRWRTKKQTLVIASDGVVLGPIDASHADDWGRLLLVEDPSNTLFAGHSTQAGQRAPQETVEMAAQLLKGFSDGADDDLTYVAGQGFTVTSSHGPHVIFGSAADTIALFHTMRPNAAATGDDVARGVALQLQELSLLEAALARQQINATVINLRWGPYPYYRTD